MSEDTCEHLETAVAPVLLQEGYERVDGLAYKARWGTADVEHFIYFEEGGRRKGYFRAYLESGIQTLKLSAWT